MYCPTFLYVQLPGEAARPAGGDVEGVVVGPTQPLTVPALHLHSQAILLIWRCRRKRQICLCAFSYGEQCIFSYKLGPKEKL